jgi:dTDP-4-amino-4,6-dideoxygalactose transaminase
MQLRRSHGVTREPHLMNKALEGDWYYQQVDLGFNYRMTEMQAALGVSQMHRVDEFVSIRKAFAKRYDELLHNLPLVLPFQHADTDSSFHLYPILIQTDLIFKTRAQVYKALREHGIGVNVHYIPIHTQPFYQAMGFAEGDFPVAEAYYQQVISIPVFHAMTTADQNRVIEILEQDLI